MRRIAPLTAGVYLALCMSAMGQSTDIKALAEAEKEPYLATLESLVNIDTPTGYVEGLAEVEAILTERLQGLGFEVKTHPSEELGGDVVLGTKAGSGDKDIMLMIHYDTVFNEGTAADRPFTITDGRATGPGVNDAKSGVALILHALNAVEKLGFDGYGQLTVLFNPDEEKGSLGSRELISETAHKQDYVLSFEASRNEDETSYVTTATKGINYAFLDVKGRASHAGAAPEEGRNAIVELSHQILQLNDLNNSELGTTLNWTMINGGTKRNVIPDHAAAEGDMRYLDPAEYDRVLNEANEIIAKKLIEDTEVSFRLDRGRPPLPPNDATKKLAEQAAAVYDELGSKLEGIEVGGGTDAAYAYNPDAATPAVLESLAPSGGNSHGVDEYLEVETIVPRIYLTTRLIMELSEGAE